MTTHLEAIDRRRSRSWLGTLQRLTQPWTRHALISPQDSSLPGEGGTPDVSSLEIITRTPDERKPLIEHWKNMPAQVVAYSGGTYPDGTRYGEGRRLLIGQEQVMDSFEEPWCRATIDKVFQEQRQGPLVVVERGFGLGIMSQLILEQMLSRGGVYNIIELNNTVYKWAREWASRANEHIKPLGINLTIQVLQGDADEIIEQTQEAQFIDILISDTYPLVEDELGINDLLGLSAMTSRLKDEGVFTFFASHKDNQGGGLDEKQLRLTYNHFRRFTVETTEVIPPSDCTYLQGPKKKLPVVLCELPRRA